MKNKKLTLKRKYKNRKSYKKNNKFLKRKSNRIKKKYRTRRRKIKKGGGENIGIIQFTVHGDLLNEKKLTMGINKTEYPYIEDLTKENNFGMKLQFIKSSSIGTCYFDTIEEQYINRQILEDFLEKDSNDLNNLVSELKEINTPITKKQINEEDDEENKKLLIQTFNNPSYTSEKTIGSVILPNQKYNDNKSFTADDDDFENDRIQWNISLLYKPLKTKKIKSIILFGEESDKNKLKKGVKYSDIFEKIVNMMKNNKAIPKFDKLLVVDFSCSPIDKALGDGNKRDSRNIIRQLKRTNTNEN